MKSAVIEGGGSYFIDLFQTFFPVFVIVMVLFCVVALLMSLYLLLIYVVKCKEQTQRTFHFSIELFWQRIRFWLERINFKLILVIFKKILCGSWNSLTWITHNKSAYCNQILLVESFGYFYLFFLWPQVILLSNGHYYPTWFNATEQDILSIW